MPDDLLNFQYDPVACATAAAWDGVTVETRNVRPIVDSAPLRFEVHPEGAPTRVLSDFDSERFNEAWLHAVESASSR